jgi:hypothetical protein
MLGNVTKHHQKNSIMKIVDTRVLTKNLPLRELIISARESVSVDDEIEIYKANQMNLKLFPVTVKFYTNCTNATIVMFL